MQQTPSIEKTLITRKCQISLLLLYIIHLINHLKTSNIIVVIEKLRLLCACSLLEVLKCAFRKKCLHSSGKCFGHYNMLQYECCHNIFSFTMAQPTDIGRFSFTMVQLKDTDSFTLIGIYMVNYLNVICAQQHVNYTNTVSKVIHKEGIKKCVFRFYIRFKVSSKTRVKIIEGINLK